MINDPNKPGEESLFPDDAWMDELLNKEFQFTPLDSRDYKALSGAVKVISRQQYRKEVFWTTVMVVTISLAGLAFAVLGVQLLQPLLIRQCVHLAGRYAPEIIFILAAFILIQWIDHRLKRLQRVTLLP